MLTIIDWAVIIVLLIASLAVGLYFSRESSSQGISGYFGAGRKLRWWAIGFSNTANYQSGAGGFVMLVLAYGLVGNWMWWASWIIWLPLVAIIWAPMWRRMQLMTTAELISIRYGGSMSSVTRKCYAFVSSFGFAVLLMGYITGFLVKTIAPVIAVTEIQVLVVLGSVTLIYTMFGGLKGVVYADVLQFIFLIVGSFIFLFYAMDQQGGFAAVVTKIEASRPDALELLPPTENFGLGLLLILVFQGLFFAGSPTAGEGSTAQRFMAARSEAEAMKGQFFNAFLALSLRVIPLIGIGLVCVSLYRTEDMALVDGSGLTLLDDPVYAWGYLLKNTVLPKGVLGFLIATEVAAYMSTLSTLINWGSSFIVNDFFPKAALGSKKKEILISRLTTLLIFMAAAVVSVFFVSDMISWFVFINSAMVIFLLPLAWFRFFWWRFNVWGELSAVIIGLPFSIIVWFGLDYQNKSMAEGLAILLVSAIVIQVTITMVTPAEDEATLKNFYRRCRPPGFWNPVKKSLNMQAPVFPKKMLIQSFLGILSCLGLVIMTNALFVDNVRLLLSGLLIALISAFLLVRNIRKPERQNNF